MADVLVLGSTGLIGRSFLRLIGNHPPYFHVLALARRELPEWKEFSNVEPLVVNFEQLHDYQTRFSAAALFCALGTTIKKAGSQENFRQVDYRLPLTLAQYALDNGCRTFILVSAVGADPGSRIFYNRVKGELERDLQKMAFAAIHILRPSLLLGERAEFRLGELLSKTFLPPLAPLLPAKYRPVAAQAVARKAVSLLSLQSGGVHIYEGAALLSDVP